MKGLLPVHNCRRLVAHGHHSFKLFLEVTRGLFVQVRKFVAIKPGCLIHFDSVQSLMLANVHIKLVLGLLILIVLDCERLRLILFLAYVLLSPS